MQIINMVFDDYDFKFFKIVKNIIDNYNFRLKGKTMMGDYKFNYLKKFQNYSCQS